MVKSSSGLDDGRTWPHRFDGIAVAVAALVLVPYPTAFLPFRTALVTQAGILLALCLCLLVWGGSRPGAIARLRSAPPLVLAGLILYTAAGALGAWVALVRGNDTTYLAGQLLSMGLLPLAALAGLLMPKPLARRFAAGLVGGVAIAAAIHFVHWAATLSQGRPLFRLYLPNAIAAVGPALMALLLAVALRREQHAFPRRLGGLGLAAAALYMVGAGVRSLWVVTPFVVAFYLLLAPSRASSERPPNRISMVKLTGGAVALAGLFLLGVWHWWQRPRPDLLPQAGTLGGVNGRPATAEVIGGDGPAAWTLSWRPGPRHRSLTLVEDLPVQSSVGYRGQLEVNAGPSGTCYLVLDWLDPQQQVVERSRSLPIDASGETRIAYATGKVPAGATGAQMRFACTEDAGGVWLLGAPGLHAIHPPGLALAAQQIRFLGQRVGNLSQLWSPGEPGDESLALRRRESQGLWDAVRSASLPERLLGHGLGATFLPRPAPGGAVAGAVEPVNYVHNFYLFLAFKLGVLGTLMVLCAVALFTAVPWRGSRRARDPSVRRFLAAATAIWVGYAVWNVACPQLLDFRMAPLWGLLIASTDPLPSPPTPERPAHDR
jgi:O-antigen ligase